MKFALSFLALQLLLISLFRGNAIAQTVSAPKHITAYVELDDNVITPPLSPAVINCYDKIDELVLAFFNPKRSYHEKIFIDDAKFLSEVEAINAKVHAVDSTHKVLMSIGGQGAKEIPYFEALISSDHRDNFIQKINDFVKAHNFDGVDIDFEDKRLLTGDYGRFLNDLNVVLKADPEKRGHKMELTVAVERDLFFNLVKPEALTNVDFVNAMSYDEGNDNFNGNRASSKYAARDLSYWHDTMKVNYQKLNLGLPFYGNKQKKEIPFCTLVESSGADTTADNVVMSDNSTVYYNGTQTIRNKVRLAQQLRIHGVMIWEIIYDHQSALLNAIDDEYVKKE